MTDRYVKAATLGLLWMVSCASQALAQDAGVQVVEFAPLDAGAGDPGTSDAGTSFDAGTRASYAPPGAGAELAAPAPSSVLALAVGPDVVDRDALRAALEAELGVVVEDAGNAPAYMPKLSVVLLPNGNTEVALSSRTVPRSTREFLLSAQLPAERVEIVTLIAANLIRNEAAALLPELAPKLQPVAEAPVAAPAPASLLDPCAAKPPREFGIDLLPGVGASSAQRGRLATRAVSLSFAGSLYDRLQGFELAYTGASIVRKSVCGVQVSGGANVSWGPVVGAQLALFNLVKGSLDGVQAGVAHVTIGDVRGAQAGVVTITHGRLRGAQLGVATYARHDLMGVQGSVLNLSLANTTGAQLAVANYTGGRLRGMQAGVLNLSLGGLEGAQLGVANYAGRTGETSEGTQLGVANISAGEIRGVQVGVFNYAERSKLSLGVLSIQRRGRTSVDLTGAIDSSLLFASVTHGGKYVHNIVGVGLRAHPGDPRMAWQLGIGVRALSTRWLRVDVDLLSQPVYTKNFRNKSASMIATVRVPVTLMITRSLGVMAALSYNFSVLDKSETRPLHNFGSSRVHSGDPNVRGFTGATFGLRYEFDHGV